MTAIPVWLTAGGGPFTVTITPQTVASDGTLSDGTLAALTGSVETLRFTNSPNQEELSPMSSRRGNMVNTKEMPSMVLEELLKSSGTNILAATNYAFDVVKVNWTRGAQAYVFFGRRGEFDDGVTSGRSTCRLVIGPVDIGSANPTYA